MIFRLLILFLIVWFLIWMFKKQLSGKQNSDTSTSPNEVEDMLACQHCGTHVPRSLGVIQNDHFYCSQEHADLDAE